MKDPYKPGTQENGIGSIGTNGIRNGLGSISYAGYHLLRQSPQISTFLSFVGTKCHQNSLCAIETVLMVSGTKNLGHVSKVCHVLQVD